MLLLSKRQRLVKRYTLTTRAIIPGGETNMIFLIVFLAAAVWGVLFKHNK